TIKPKGRVEKISDIVLKDNQTLSEMLYMKTDLLKDDGTLIARNWYFCNYETHRGVMQESCAADVCFEQDGNTITIKNQSDWPAVGVTIDVPGMSSSLLLSDNYLWIDPGETVIVDANTSRPAIVKWWNSKNK
ncbi:glycoside hydrolase family 2 protein, partial [Xylanibacter caecicola]|uniref:glycoside hydrolase family 2 protein n=1 Tax=Xylanibacter caecicola TaxID=2736294 RepID=UPI003334164F